MIIRYSRERIENRKWEDNSLTLGKDYVALVLDMEPQANNHLVVIQRESDKLACQFYLKFFDIIDPRIPEDWCMRNRGDGCYDLQPQEFTGDFWDWYHDGNEEQVVYAGQILNNVVIKIKRFHDRWDL